MSSLKDLEFKISYRTGIDNILNDFYIPCLKHSKLYYRGVGYFTSDSLCKAADGLEVFIENGGNIRLVACPILDKEDTDAIIRGYELREDRIKAITDKITPILINEIQKMSENGKHHLEVLSWLIADDKLDIKLALKHDGIYHEKFGVFFEDNNESSYKVAFIGSNNETAGGLIHNFEHISIFEEKDQRDKQRILEFVEDFSKLWINRTSCLDVVSLPEEVKEIIIRNKPSKAPVHIVSKHKDLRGYQKDAIRKWQNNNNCGILSMVTGSGKTYTALMAIKNLVSKGKTPIIIVPSEELLRQWEEEVKNEFPNAYIFICGGYNPDWDKEIVRYLRQAKLNSINTIKDNINPVILISTLDTAREQKFQSNIKLSNIDLKDIVMIVDEVHKAGSIENRHIFDISPEGGRLGLSATPLRRGDEEGNGKILDFFGDIVFTFSIHDAIQHKPPVLTKYDYFMHVVYLTEQELEDYIEITKQLGKYKAILATYSGEDYNYDESIRMQLIKRKAIIKSAVNKASALRDIIRNYKPKRCLVYCNDNTQVNDMFSIVVSEGIRACKYTSGQLNPDQRKQAIDLFKDDESDYLIAVKCLDEGVDIPSCESAIIISSSTNEREFIQRRGRVLRLHKQKEKAIIHDMIVLPCNPNDNDISISITEYKLLTYELNRALVFALDANNASDVIIQINNINRSISRLVEE